MKQTKHYVYTIQVGCIDMLDLKKKLITNCTEKLYKTITIKLLQLL